MYIVISVIHHSVTVFLVQHVVVFNYTRIGVSNNTQFSIDKQTNNRFLQVLIIYSERPVLPASLILGKVSVVSQRDCDSLSVTDPKINKL